MKRTMSVFKLVWLILYFFYVLQIFGATVLSTYVHIHICVFKNKIKITKVGHQVVNTPSWNNIIKFNDSIIPYYVTIIKLTDHYARALSSGLGLSQTDLLSSWEDDSWKVIQIRLLRYFKYHTAMQQRSLKWVGRHADLFTITIDSGSWYTSRLYGS